MSSTARFWRTLRAAAVALAIATGCAAAFSACGDSEESEQASASSKAGDSGVVLGLLTFQGDAFFQSVQNGAQQEADRRGASLRIENTNNDVNKEAQVVNNMVAGGAKAIMISPLSTTSSLSAIKTAVDAGLKVICYNTCLGPEDTKKYTSASVTTDHHALGVATGKATAEYIEAELGGSAKLGMLNCDVFEACKQRKAGFQSQLDGLDVEYAADQQAFVIDKATPVAQNILTANPDLDLMWASNEGGTEGIVAAVKASGRKLPVFGSDISPLLAKDLLASDDILQATTGQQAEKIGIATVDAALQAVEGKQVSPREILVPTVFYSREDPAVVQKYLAAHEPADG